MKNTTPLIKNIKYVCITLMLLFNIHFTYSQVDLRTCGFDCTSNNYTLTDVYLSLSDVDGTPIGNTPCTIGDVQQVYIYLNYTSNANSSVYYARLNADLNIGGVSTFLNVYLGQIVPGSNIKLLYGPFDWVCGDELDLSDTIIAWKTSSSNNPGENYQCNSFSNAQCDYTNEITISKPLAVQFTYTACTVGSETTVNFTSTTNGGKEPYTYAWDFDNDGGPADSTLPNPTHVYTTQNNTAKLTVTDFENMSNSYTVLIVEPTELMLSESHTSVGCSGGTSSITLTVSGGTPGYTYLWNTGATTKDLADVPPGDYNVTVTDSYNCSKQLFVTIEDGDTVIPVIDPLPDPSTINCPESPSFEQATATDNSGSISSLTYTDETTPGSCPGTYSVTRTWIAKDACDNESLPVSQTITVEDTTPPSWITGPQDLDVTLECSDSDGLAAAQLQEPVAEDSCNDVSYTKTSGSFVSSGCANAGTYTNTWIATDECGNVSEVFTQIITIEDTTAPVWSSEPMELDITLECSDL
ncbi:PKD domain-containing protein, partial [Flavobacterium rakeshii]|nr:PKD domain-containing protein [Flavobacterium rakeshii]